MTTLRALGQKDEGAKQLRTSDPDRFQVAEAIRIGVGRSGEGETLRLTGLGDDDVLELTFEEGGLRRWLTVKEYEQEFGQASRSEKAGELVIPSSLSIGTDRQRGLTSWGLKLLRVFGIKPLQAVTRNLPKYYDKKLVGTPGLYRANKLDALGPAVTAAELPQDKPLLIFLHGTASSTSGSFGALHPSVQSELQQEYGDRILALEHHTLGRHPVENALDLVRALPRRATLHMVSHSRGGMIGELICRATRLNAAAIDDLDRSLFTNHPKHIVKALEELGAELASRRIKVERFVRVACPAGGTLLASKRLDRWLEVILNIVDHIPIVGGNPIFDVLSDLLKDLKRGAGDPADIPGVAAMVPGSALVRLLNRPDVELEANLSVVAGDSEGSGIWGRISLFFADLYYREDHDLVVHTRAMFGGSTRKEPGSARFYFDRGAEVNHFHYFANPATARKLREGLAGNESAFDPIDSARRTKASRGITTRSFLGRSDATKPRVFVLPGIMGTHLQVGEDRIWLDLLDLAWGGLSRLHIGATDVSPESLVARSYEDLCESLCSTHQVLPFPYDWRLPILEEARRFGEAVQAALRESEEPIRILAHSMGGLVARIMFHVRPDVWEELKKRSGFRLVMLGTPNGGSFSIPRVMLGRDQIVRSLAMVDLRNSLDEMLSILSDFPGLLNLLPAPTEDWDLLQPAAWKRLADAHGEDWHVPSDRVLRACGAAREALEKSPVDPERMLYVAGVADDTPFGIEIDESAKGAERIRFLGTSAGDGRVPWDTGILREPSANGQPGKPIPTWYMRAGHGDLADHRDAFGAISELLLFGETQLLGTRPPAIRSVDRSYPLRDDRIEVYPDQDELERLVLHMEVRSAVQERERPPIQVNVAHGNLAFCKHPVAVGHYEDDGFYGAEWALDHALDGRLYERRQLGLYPGPSGTYDVILQTKAGAQPGGAIVIGLGVAGGLSPRVLMATTTAALLEYGLRASEDPARRKDTPAGSPMELSVTSLLIGSGEDGVSLAESIASFLQAARDANERLMRERPDKPVLIRTIRFIELYKDKAIRAAELLCQQCADSTELEAVREVQTLDGGRWRAAFSEHDGWWSRIHIRTTDTGRLHFGTPGRRARVEESSLSVQRGNIDKFIRQAVQQRQWDQRLSSTLFELMIPNGLKRHAKTTRDVLLVLDRDAARYPWELLHDRHFGGKQPMAVKLGMVRQLTTERFRAHVVPATTTKALVVGDPPSEFVELPGAEAEAGHVADVLDAGGYEVRREIKKTSSSAVMTSLLSDDYRIVHLAGHGVFEYWTGDEDDHGNERIVTGMVLGDGVFLTAQEIRQMREVPELVFVNCCHLGLFGPDGAGDEPREKTVAEKDPGVFAASFAHELIAMGVPMVVVAGWAVDDAAAETFAQTFYACLLEGREFGQAVKLGRERVFTQHGSRTNTWGAYQCYGDPSYKLSRTGLPREEGALELVDADELVALLRNIASDAKASRANLGPADQRRTQDELKIQLQTLHELASNDHDGWLKLAQVQDAFGRACGELGLFAQAMDHYGEALQAENSEASVRAVEQRANLRARHAAGAPDLTLREKRERCRQSTDELEGLIQACGVTWERGSLLGSTAKRLASIERGSRRDAALRSMVDGYKAALHSAQSRREPGVVRAEDEALHYPLNNALVGEAVLHWRNPKRAKPDPALVAEALPVATREAAVFSDIWAALAVPDAALATALAQGDAGAIGGLAAQYEQVLTKRGSPRELGSVVDHVAFLMAVLGPGKGAGSKPSMRRKLYTELERLHAALAALKL